MHKENRLITFIREGKPRPPASPSYPDLLRYVGQRIVFTVLIGLSYVYRSGVQLRLALYHRNIFKRTQLPCPIISIGNITTGGTGKTPTVIEVARILREEGRHVAVLSRGYHRQSTQEAQVVTSDANVREAGDEPLLIAQKLTPRSGKSDQNIPVIVGSQRARSAEIALAQFGADILVLDDGFQHVQVARTCDLVLIDATQPFGGERLLPAGFLREPLKNLARAHGFLITHSDEGGDLSEISQRLRSLNPSAPIFQGRHACDTITPISSAEPVAMSHLQSRRILAISGLGNPASFQRLLVQQGLTIVQHLEFPDHHWYSPQDAEQIQEAILQHRIEGIITTEKDTVKLSAYTGMWPVPCYVMRIKMDIHPQDDFKDFLRTKIRQNR